MATTKRIPTADEQAQREARTSQLLAQLEAGVEAIQTGDDFRRYLRFAARFHRYSYNNVLLILAQRPEVTRVAGYRAWQRLGRQVRKGERAIYVFAPRPYLVQPENDNGDEETRAGLAFRSVPVWDVSQTGGDPLPSLDVPALTGDHGQAVYAALVAYAERAGLTVTNHDPDTEGDDTHSSYHGYYSPRRKLIFVQRAAPAQMVKTLIHELGHVLDPELLATPRAEHETVAEATAFVVAAHVGIDTGSYSFPYIAAWAGREEGASVIKTVMGRVQGIAHRIIAGIEDAGDAGADEPPPAAAALRVGARLAA